MLIWLDTIILIINTIFIVITLWLSYVIIKSGWLHNYTYYGQGDKQYELRWVILKRLMVLIALSLMAGIFNIFFA